MAFATRSKAPPERFAEPDSPPVEVPPLHLSGKIPVKAVPMKETHVTSVPIRAIHVKAPPEAPNAIPKEDRDWKSVLCMDSISDLNANV